MVYYTVYKLFFLYFKSNLNKENTIKSKIKCINVFAFFREEHNIEYKECVICKLIIFWISKFVECQK